MDKMKNVRFVVKDIYNIEIIINNVYKIANLYK